MGMGEISSTEQTWAEQEKKRENANLKVYAMSGKWSVGYTGSWLPAVFDLLCHPHLMGAWEKSLIQGPGVAWGSCN